MDYEALMQEQPDGLNHGRLNGLHLDTNDLGYVLEGFHIVDATKGEGGIRAHRGVVAKDEYVDPATLKALVEDEFGFSLDEVASVYTVKKIRHDQRQLRGDIDSRVLALSRSGANMAQLANVLEINPRTMERALARARQAESA